MKVSKKKPISMGNDAMKQFHQMKQKGMGKWTDYLRQGERNPDCYSLEGYLVVRLFYLAAQEAEAYGDNEVIQSKDGFYYGVLGRIADSESEEESDGSSSSESSHSSHDDDSDDGPPLISNPNKKGGAKKGKKW